MAPEKAGVSAGSSPSSGRPRTSPYKRPGITGTPRRSTAVSEGTMEATLTPATGAERSAVTAE